MFAAERRGRRAGVSPRGYTAARGRGARQGETGQAIILVLIVVAIIAALVWWLILARQESEAQARDFARDAATRLAFALDRKFLDRTIAPERAPRYPPSFRDRIVDKLRGFGRPTAPPEMSGDVYFSSYFFQPSGTFRAQFRYPQMPVEIHMAISRPKGWWQIDDLNISWDQPAPPEPVPAAAAPPAQSPGQ